MSVLGALPKYTCRSISVKVPNCKKLCRTFYFPSDSIRKPSFAFLHMCQVLLLINWYKTTTYFNIISFKVHIIFSIIHIYVCRHWKMFWSKACFYVSFSFNRCSKCSKKSWLTITFSLHFLTMHKHTCRQSMRQIREHTLSKGMCSTIKPTAAARFS